LFGSSLWGCLGFSFMVDPVKRKQNYSSTKDPTKKKKKEEKKKENKIKVF
jgi:hypothetical protein